MFKLFYFHLKINDLSFIFVFYHPFEHTKLTEFNYKTRYGPCVYQDGSSPIA